MIGIFVTTYRLHQGFSRRWLRHGSRSGVLVRVKQDGFRDNMILRAIGQVALFALRNHNRISAAFAGLLIHGDKDIGAGRNGPRQINRAQVTYNSSRHPLESLQRASCGLRLHLFRTNPRNQYEIRMQHRDVRFGLLCAATGSGKRHDDNRG